MNDVPEVRTVPSSTYPIADRGAAAVLLVSALFVAPVFVWAHSHPERTLGITANFELRMLVWSALLSLLLPLIQIVGEIKLLGGDAVRGNRESYPLATGFAGRVGRAHANLIQALAPFAAVVLAAHALGVSKPLTVAAAAMFLASRIVHAVTYAAGIPIVRSAAFYAGLTATVIIAAELPLFG